MASYSCASVKCMNIATMQCPTCVELKIADEQSFFCAQDCFKASWAQHKVFHKAAKAQQKLVSGPLAVNFAFTGLHRPYPQSPTRVVPREIGRPDYADNIDGMPLSESKSRATEKIRPLGLEESEKMRVACRLGREVLDEASKIIAPGITTDDIDRLVHQECVKRNCYPSPLNYHGFPKSCCTSVNEIICHGIPDGYKLKDGDIVNVDVTVYHNGYHGDLNETFLVGKVDEESLRLVKCTYDALMGAIALCKPGVAYRDIGKAIAKIVDPHKFSIVTNYCGHGINNLFHTAPNIPHYAKNKAKGEMEVGHVFTIEPMINVGVSGDVLWEFDNWTSATKDGKRSAQFEHTMIVTETGVEILTARLPTSPCGMQWFETYEKSLNTLATVSDSN